MRVDQKQKTWSSGDDFKVVFGQPIEWVISMSDFFISGGPQIKSLLSSEGGGMYFSIISLDTYPTLPSQFSGGWVSV